jgi:hypothetical protein
MDPLQHAQDHHEREDRKHRTGIWRWLAQLIANAVAPTAPPLGVEVPVSISIPAVVADRYTARKFRLMP